MQQHRLFPMFMLVLGIIILGGGSVYARASEGNVFANMFFRLAFALPFYTFIVWRAKQYKRRYWRDDNKTNIILLLVAGVFFALDTLCFFTAIKYTTIGFTLLIASCVPLVVVPLSVLVYKELPPKLFWLGLGLAMLGMYLAIGTGLGGGSGHPHEWKGFIYAFFALLAFGFYVFILSFCQTSLGVWQKMIIMCAPSLLTIAIVSWIGGYSLLLPSAISWVAILGFSINSQMIGQSMLVYAMQRIPVNISGIFTLGFPFVGMIYGWVFFRETITWLGFGGMVICLIGIYLAKRAYDSLEQAHGHQPQEEITPPT